MLNEDTLKGKWKELKGEIKSFWGEMNDDELDKSSGNVQSIVGLLQQKFGSKKEEIEERLNQMASKFSEKSGEVKENLRRDQDLH